MKCAGILDLAASVTRLTRMDAARGSTKRTRCELKAGAFLQAGLQGAKPIHGPALSTSMMRSI